MSSGLLSLAAQLGLPMLEKVLSGRLGDKTGKFASEAVGLIARQMGVGPDEVSAIAEGGAQGREELAAAMEATEARMPEMIALHQAELEAKLATFEAEVRGPWWAWAWRPAGMWGLLFLWLYNVALLHWANAVWKIALPPVDYATLLQVSALYMSLYMGGHTVKSVLASRGWGRRNGRG